MGILEKGITAKGTGIPEKFGTSWARSIIPKQPAIPPSPSRRTPSRGAVRAGSCSSNAGRVHPDAGRHSRSQARGCWVQAKVGDLVRLPRGIPHGYFNKSNRPARAFFWVSPTRKLEALFDKLHGLTDPAEVVAISSQHEVDFMPPEAND